MKLTLAEINQLLAYCEERDRDGWYYGVREHFEKRHESIVKKLNLMIKDSK